MTEGEWPIPVNEEASTEAAPNWVSEATKKIENLSQSRSLESKEWEMESIYRIPWSVKKLHLSAYQPQMVSIGPYHHGEAQLVGMEKHKERAFHNFVGRSMMKLQLYVDALTPVVEDLKSAYDQLQPKWRDDSEAFLKLMIVDGCFILELMRIATTDMESWSEIGYAYEHNDKIFSQRGLIYFYPILKRDVLVLENQLPMKVLHQLLATEGSTTPHDGLTRLILKFFDRWESHHRVIEFEECSHILDLYRKSLTLECNPKKLIQKQEQIQIQIQKQKQKKLEKDEYIRSATELVEAGIKFEVSETRKLDDILFKNGVLKLPAIELVDETLESKYLNMLAFEQSHAAGREVTSYLFFMGKLIDSAKDVSLLYQHRVIRKSLATDHAVANLFNSLSSWEANLTLDPDNKLFQVQKEVSKYYWSRLQRYIAFAKHNYFANPWVTLSVLAAIFLFALTTVQTAYSVLGYYDDHRKNASKH